jgi:hypothetical protein
MKKESKSNKNASRREFLTLKWSKRKNEVIDSKSTGEITTKKMLMADGTLVEVRLPVEILSTKKKKATNREILEWRKGPQFNSK